MRLFLFLFLCITAIVAVVCEDVHISVDVVVGQNFSLPLGSTVLTAEFLPAPNEGSALVLLSDASLWKIGPSSFNIIASSISALVPFPSFPSYFYLVGTEAGVQLQIWSNPAGELHSLPMSSGSIVESLFFASSLMHDVHDAPDTTLVFLRRKNHRCGRLTRADGLEIAAGVMSYAVTNDRMLYVLQSTDINGCSSEIGPVSLQQIPLSHILNDIKEKDLSWNLVQDQCMQIHQDIYGSFPQLPARMLLCLRWEEDGIGHWQQIFPTVQETANSNANSKSNVTTLLSGAAYEEWLEEMGGQNNLPMQMHGMVDPTQVMLLVAPHHLRWIFMTNQQGQALTAISNAEGKLWVPSLFSASASFASSASSSSSATPLPPGLWQVTHPSHVHTGWSWVEDNDNDNDKETAASNAANVALSPLLFNLHDVNGDNPQLHVTLISQTGGFSLSRLYLADSRPWNVQWDGDGPKIMTMRHQAGHIWAMGQVGDVYDDAIPPRVIHSSNGGKTWNLVEQAPVTLLSWHSMDRDDSIVVWMSSQVEECKVALGMGALQPLWSASLPAAVEPDASLRRVFSSRQTPTLLVETVKGALQLWHIALPQNTKIPLCGSVEVEPWTWEGLGIRQQFIRARETTTCSMAAYSAAPESSVRLPCSEADFECNLGATGGWNQDLQLQCPAPISPAAQRILLDACAALQNPQQDGDVFLLPSSYRLIPGTACLSEGQNSLPHPLTTRFQCPGSTDATLDSTAWLVRLFLISFVMCGFGVLISITILWRLRLKERKHSRILGRRTTSAGMSSSASEEEQYGAGADEGVGVGVGEQDHLLPVFDDVEQVEMVDFGGRGSLLGEMEDVEEPRHAIL
jgi:hypothetical protein